MRKSRLIIGLALIVAAVLLFVFGEGRYSDSGVVALAVLGLVSIAISRRK
jgi:multisubunit Na+/H+ antiporter MnhC subunit